MLVGVFGKTQAVFGIFCLIKLHSQLLKYLSSPVQVARQAYSIK